MYESRPGFSEPNHIIGAHYNANPAAYHKNTGRIRSKLAELRDRDGRRAVVVHTPYITLESVASPIGRKGREERCERAGFVPD